MDNFCYAVIVLADKTVISKSQTVRPKFAVCEVCSDFKTAKEIALKTHDRFGNRVRIYTVKNGRTVGRGMCVNMESNFNRYDIVRDKMPESYQKHRSFPTKSAWMHEF